MSDEAKEEEAKLRKDGLSQCTQNRKDLPDKKEAVDELYKLLKKLGF